MDVDTFVYEKDTYTWTTFAISGISNIFTTVIASITLWVFNKIYQVQPTPYLDEVFHIPQGIEYCHGNFSHWDPKITTLPGLYGLSIGVLIPMAKLLGIQAAGLCTVYFLRLTNFIASGVNFYLFYDLQKRIHGIKEDLDVPTLFSSVTLYLFPVLYFFTFLYYTDTVSTALVLLMYDLHLVRHKKSAAFMGLAACLVRQSNIIWVAFLMLEAFPMLLSRHNHVFRFRKELASNRTQLEYFKVMHKCLMHTIKNGGIEDCASFVFDYVAEISKYLVVCGLFTLFVILNGGIVVGDRAAHQPALHLLQLCYFVAFAVVMGAPYFVGEILSFLKIAYYNKRFMLCVWAALAIVVYFFSIEHPYLLADNRHYVFYIWQRIYRKYSVLRYLMIFVYMFGAYGIMKQLKHTAITFRLHFCICLFLFLVPQKLLEFRYFIIPYLFFRLHVVPNKKQLAAEFCLYAFINAVTVYLFLTNTFYWPNSLEQQRFIW